MAENIEAENIDWATLYEHERSREPVRQLCPGIDRHFQWEASNDQHKVPIDWLEHYASAFHFTDEELLAARSTADLPRASGIYFLFDGDECVYVGETKDVSQRLEQHLENGLWWTSHVYFEAPKFHARDIEAHYIRRINPRLNASCPPNRTYSDIVKRLGLDRRREPAPQAAR